MKLFRAMLVCRPAGRQQQVGCLLRVPHVLDESYFLFSFFSNPDIFLNPIRNSNSYLRYLFQNERAVK